MSAATITATITTSQRAVRLSITITGAAAGETMTLYRRVGSAALVPVMGATAIAAASRVITDPEVPLNRAASWVVKTSTNVQVESATLTVAAPLPTVADPVRGVTAACAVVDRDTVSRQQRADVLQVEGDSDPVVIWDVPAGARTPISLLTLTAVEAANMDRVVSAGNPLLLRCSCGQHTDQWIQPVETIVGARVVRKSSDPNRTWDLGSCILFASSPVSGTLARGNTLGMVYAAVASKTLAGIAATWSTLGAIAVADLGASV